MIPVGIQLGVCGRLVERDGRIGSQPIGNDTITRIMKQGREGSGDGKLEGKGCGNIERRKVCLILFRKGGVEPVN